MAKAESGTNYKQAVQYRAVGKWQCQGSLVPFGRVPQSWLVNERAQPWRTQWNPPEPALPAIPTIPKTNKRNADLPAKGPEPSPRLQTTELHTNFPRRAEWWQRSGR